MTGEFSPTVKARVMARAGGRCECCHRPTLFGEYHHRRNRGMGGSSDPATARASNCLWLCGECHRWATDNKPAARELGVVVSNFCTDPSSVPVRRYGRWVLLDDAGGLSPGGVS